MTGLIMALVLAVTITMSASGGGAGASVQPVPSPAVSVQVAAANPEQAERRFWVRDKHRYRSPWYAGKRRKMINFGCTSAPHYPPSARCKKDRGFHHGLDVAMPCGTPLFAGLSGRVVKPQSAGALGPAYGRKAFRIRNHRLELDFVIGHTRRVFVEPGQRVRRGQRIARASDAAAPDGCHLHFEVRPQKTGYRAAVRPHPHLALRRGD